MTMTGTTTYSSEKVCESKMRMDLCLLAGPARGNSQNLELVADSGQSDLLTARSVLKSLPYSELHRLKVVENPRDISISGKVSCFFLKQLVQESLRPILAGRRLHNQVVVVSPSNELGVRPAIEDAIRTTVKNGNNPACAQSSAHEQSVNSVCRVVIASGNVGLNKQCDDLLKNDCFTIEVLGSGLELLSLLQNPLPDILVVADPLPWGGGEGVLHRLREMKILQQLRVIYVASPDSIDRLAVDLWDQLDTVLLGNDYSAQHVACTVKRAFGEKAAKDLPVRKMSDHAL